MLALIVHATARPPLSKGTMLVPLQRWEDAPIPLRMLRQEAKRSGRSPSPYVTLVNVPEKNIRVAIITGEPEGAPPESEFFELPLPAEKQRLIDESWKHFRDAGGGELPIGWLARLVLGEKLPAGSVKWTKDFRLLKDGVRNATTKRT